VVDPLASGLLGSHVQHGPFCTVFANTTTVGTSQTKVENLHLALGGEHDVLGLQIPVYELERRSVASRCGPCLVQTVGDLTADFNRGLSQNRGVRSLAYIEDVAQSDPMYGLHDDGMLGVEELEHLAHGAVVDLCQQLKLLKQCVTGLSICGVS
jgi:hypothetical protein